MDANNISQPQLLQNIDFFVFSQPFFEVNHQNSHFMQKKIPILCKPKIPNLLEADPLHFLSDGHMQMYFYWIFTHAHRRTHKYLAVNLFTRSSKIIAIKNAFMPAQKRAIQCIQCIGYRYTQYTNKYFFFDYRTFFIVLMSPSKYSVDKIYSTSTCIAYAVIYVHNDGRFLLLLLVRVVRLFVRLLCLFVVFVCCVLRLQYLFYILCVLICIQCQKKKYVCVCVYASAWDQSHLNIHEICFAELNQLDRNVI